VYAITSTASVAKKVLIIAVMGAATAGGLLYTDAGHQAVEVFHGRIIQQTDEDRYLDGREDLWLTAIEMAGERPVFGWGLGGFVFYNLTYPHNVFLEALVAGGLVGLLLLMVLLWASFSRILRNPRHLSRLQIAAFVLVLTAAQTSGDLFDSRGIFLLASLFCPAQAAPIRARRLPQAGQRAAGCKVRCHAVSMPHLGRR
jgi:O-antigen ligase